MLCKFPLSFSVSEHKQWFGRWDWVKDHKIFLLGSINVHLQCRLFSTVGNSFLARYTVEPRYLKTIGGFHMTELKFKLENYWSTWDFTFMMYKNSWKLVFIRNFCSEWVLGFVVVVKVVVVVVIDYAWISKLLSDAAFTWRRREPREVMSGNLAIWTLHVFMYSCIRQGIILMFLRSSRNTFTLSVAKLSVSVGFAIEVLHGSNVAWREQWNYFRIRKNIFFPIRK